MTVASGNDPSTLASLHPTMGLELRFRSYKNAQRMWGSHYLALKQASRIPESTRRYVPGDPVNLIDWKAFARTDQLLLREIRDEAAAKVDIVLDLSETALWPLDRDIGVSTHVVSKAEVIVRVGFHLAHTFMRQGDFVALWLIQEDRQTTPDLRFAPRSPADLIGVYDELIADPTLAPSAFVTNPGFSRARDLGYWIGDGLGAGSYLDLARESRRFYLLHILSSLERDIEWLKGEATYFDSYDQVREYRGSTLKSQEAYAQQLSRWMKRLEKQVNGEGGHYLTLDDSTTIHRYLNSLYVSEREE